MTKRDLLDLFCARRGIVSVVGAGGKKTTIYRLMTAHDGRVATTTTVHTPPFRKRLGAQVIIAVPRELPEKIRQRVDGQVKIAYAHPSDKPARLSGVHPDTISRIHREFHFDATFVKADGARLRWIKAPNHMEPILPADSSVLIPVVSIRALGKPLSDEVAHRARIVSAVTGAKMGDRITAAHIARLLASDGGGLKNAGAAKVIPVINMVENREQLEIARSVASQVFELTPLIGRIVIAAMERDDPVIDVVQNPNYELAAR